MSIWESGGLVKDGIGRNLRFSASVWYTSLLWYLLSWDSSEEEEDSWDWETARGRRDLP